MKKISKYQNSVLIIGTILTILVFAIILFPHRNVSLASPNKIVNSKVTKKVVQKVKKLHIKILIYHIRILKIYSQLVAGKLKVKVRHILIW